MILPRVQSVDREPIVYNDNEKSRVQTCDDGGRSFFPAKPTALKGPVLEKRGSQKGLGDACVSFHPTGVVNLAFVAISILHIPLPYHRCMVVFSYDLRRNKRLNKQSWGWWFETPLLSFWRHCNVCSESDMKQNACLLYEHKALLARVVYALTFDWTWWDCSATGKNWHQCPTVELKKYPWCLEYLLVSLTIVCYVYFSIIKLICLLMFPYDVLCNVNFSVTFWVGVIFAHIINEYSLLVGGTCKISR